MCFVPVQLITSTGVFHRKKETKNKLPSQKMLSFPPDQVASEINSAVAIANFTCMQNRCSGKANGIYPSRM